VLVLTNVGSALQECRAADVTFEPVEPSCRQLTVGFSARRGRAGKDRQLTFEAGRMSAHSSHDKHFSSHVCRAESIKAQYRAVQLIRQVQRMPCQRQTT
jgi:hypothetical protein